MAAGGSGEISTSIPETRESPKLYWTGISNCTLDLGGVHSFISGLREFLTECDLVEKFKVGLYNSLTESYDIIAVIKLTRKMRQITVENYFKKLPMKWVECPASRRSDVEQPVINLKEYLEQYPLVYCHSAGDAAVRTHYAFDPCVTRHSNLSDQWEVAYYAPDRQFYKIIDSFGVGDVFQSPHITVTQDGSLYPPKTLLANIGARNAVPFEEPVQPHICYQFSHKRGRDLTDAQITYAGKQSHQWFQNGPQRFLINPELNYVFLPRYYKVIEQIQFRVIPEESEVARVIAPSVSIQLRVGGKPVPLESLKSPLRFLPEHTQLHEIRFELERHNFRATDQIEMHFVGWQCELPNYIAHPIKLFQTQTSEQEEPRWWVCYFGLCAECTNPMILDKAHLLPSDLSQPIEPLPSIPIRMDRIPQFNLDEPIRVPEFPSSIFD